MSFFPCPACENHHSDGEECVTIKSLQSALDFILSKERYTFTECALAEDIMNRARQALEEDQKEGGM